MKKSKLKLITRSSALIMILSILLSVTNIVYAATYNPDTVVKHAKSLVGESYDNGFCLRFVKECFSSCYGFTSSACCAYTYSKTYKDSTSMNDIPLGADVFFKGSGTTCSTCGNKAGHIGIYVGDGYCVHAMNGKIQKTKVSTIDGYSNLDYIGWGWHGNKTFITVPSAPTISSVTASDDNSIKIKWGSVSGATKYILQGRKAGGEYATIAELTDTSYTHKGLDAGSLYWYHVKASNSAGSSGYSSADAAYTKPNAPTTSITGSTSTIKVKWSSSGGSTYYELLARKCGDEKYTTIAGNVDGYTYTHTGLEAGTQYYYRIKAHNKEHTSIVSAESGTGTGYTKLNAPRITSKGAQNISLAWNGFKGNGEYTYTYRVKRCIVGAAEYTDIATTSKKSYDDASLVPNTTYRYYIDVLRNGEYIIHSETIDVKTDIQLPTGISLSQGNLTLTEGNTYALTTYILPENTTDKSVVWVSDNTNVASVSGNGVITAHSQGTANIYATTVNGLTMGCAVTVTHSYGDWETERQATCQHEGIEYRACNICGKEEYQFKAQVSCNYIITEKINPSETDIGYSIHKCSYCNNGFTNIDLKSDSYCGQIFVALYSVNNKLQSVKCYTPAESITLSLEYTQIGEYVKIMWWDGLKRMEPIRNSLILPRSKIL